MIWLTWRQHRRQALFTGIALVLLAAMMIPTGLAMRRAFASLGLPDCVGKLADASPDRAAIAACGPAFRQFNSQYSTLGTVGVLFLVLPLLVGLFWGAPLVAREVEQGTHRLVWTQGISRRRWALVKFGFVGAATLAMSVLYGLGTSWWLTPLSQAGQQGRFNVFFFDMQGLVPIGYTLFAVALGIFAGAVWRKVLPAMAVTLGGFVGVRIALTALARPNYIPPRTLTFLVQGATEQPSQVTGDWILSNGIRDASGKMVAAGAQAACQPGAQGPAGVDCGAEFGAGAYNWQLYQPGDRYWAFQSIETGIFIALAALLLYLAIRQIRRVI
jgi:ABC-type transport system involved in multi-copper enzyme maturation permease subunit